MEIGILCCKARNSLYITWLVWYHKLLETPNWSQSHWQLM